MKEQRTVIIGLDGVPYGLLEGMSQQGIMPAVSDIIAKGTFSKMSSSIPEISSVAWSTIITGKNPAEHGIFGFTDFPPNTYRLSFPNFSSLRAPAFWESDSQRRHIIMNVPATYPAKPMNGVLISGFVALDLERAVYPASLVPELRDFGYKVDVDSGKAHESLELFMTDLKRTHQARVKAYRHLWSQEWSTFMFVFTGTDRLMHFLWDAWEDSTHRFHQEFKDYFKAVDEVIGEIVSKMKPEDSLIMISDHGFERLDYDIYLNYLLKDKGFLKLKEVTPVTFGSIDSGTKAFALDPSRIYINLEGKYPLGSVTQSQREVVMKEIDALFSNLEVNNEKVIKQIYRKEEIYSGPYLEHAPDMVLIANKGFNLKAAINSAELCSKGVFTGKHTQDDAFLLVNRECDKTIIPENPKVSDVVGIMNRLKRRSNETQAFEESQASGQKPVG